MNLCEEIIAAARKKGIDPFKTPFKPSDLNLNASDYGSFSDWCKIGETKSAKYKTQVCLTVAERTLNGKPYRYLLRPRDQWIE